MKIQELKKDDAFRLWGGDTFKLVSTVPSENKCECCGRNLVAAVNTFGERLLCPTTVVTPIHGAV